MKHFFFISILFIVSVGVIAQNQNNIWYFGERAGLDFNSGSPVALTNSQMSSREGCAVMNDKITGSLLFYTNGGPGPNQLQDTVGAIWNRNHQIMPNGDLDSAGGCMSSAQGALIVPNPANADQYYLFTLDCAENFFVSGLRYSIIDMTLDGGLGDVTVKGVQLTDSVNENMCAIKHANGTDYWLLFNKGNSYVNFQLISDKYHAYQITSSGILPPVITSIGPGYPSTSSIKANLSGTKICHIGDTTNIALFDFDNNTGILSNYIDLNAISYSSAFSPNCRFLYCGAPKLVQYDLDAPNIPASEVVISNTGSQQTMQLGPDGKIYMAEYGSDSLQVIHYPDQLGVLCNYVKDGVYLGGRVSEAGLPNVINGLYGPCDFRTGVETNTPTGIDVTIHPNPSTGVFTVQGAVGEIQVYDLFGRLLLRSNKSEIDMSNYPAGLYVWQVGEARGKVVIE